MGDSDLAHLIDWTGQPWWNGLERIRFLYWNEQLGQNKWDSGSFKDGVAIDACSDTVTRMGPSTGTG